MGRYTKILKNKAMKKLTSDKKIRDIAYQRSLAKVEKHKKELIEDFENHPVTRELEAGSTAKNISGTVTGGGNLFSFIGFHDGSDPVSSVSALLNAGVSMSKKPKITKGKNRVYYQYKVRVPNKNELASVSKMPWEPGSWLFRIEKGISGLGHYIYKNYISSSRSGTGIQADGKYRKGAVFKKTRYMSAILRTFNSKFRGK
jgi:hypothetical protein